MTVAAVAACAAVLTGGLLQSATGFGFALVAVPALTAALGPVPAVSAAVVLGLVVNVLTLAGEGRRPSLLGRRAMIIIAGSVPGMALGALALAKAPTDALRLLVAAVTFASVIAYARYRNGAVRPAGEWSAASTGVVAGAIGAASGINGPPLVAHLRRCGASPAQMRDTLATIFLATGVLTGVALFVAGALRVQPLVLVLITAAVVGQGLGRLTFNRIGNRREALVIAVLALSTALATLPVIQAAGA